MLLHTTHSLSDFKLSVQPLGVESVSLVYRLLHDLKEVTEAKEETEQKLEHAQNEALELAQRLQPLTQENAELTRENNSVGGCEGCTKVERMYPHIFQTL